MKAIWGKADINNVRGPVPPNEAQVLNREPIDLPNNSPGTIELAEMVSQADKLTHELALKKLGLSEKLLERLRGLDELAKSSGHFIAISLEKTHRSYYLQSLELMEVASKLRDRLMLQPGQDGYIANDEARAFFNRNYVEMVKEGGRAFELMLTGAQAMVKMMMDTKGMDGSGGTRRKPGWRKVTAAERHDAKAGS